MPAPGASRTLPGAAQAAMLLAPAPSGVPMPPVATRDEAGLEVDPPRVSHTSVGDPAFWPRMLELCTGNRRLRVVLEGAELRVNTLQSRLAEERAELRDVAAAYDDGGEGD